MALVNRVSEHVNRKKLIVQETTKNASGDITSLIVDIERAEGNVSSEGTKLNATNLNNEIVSLVNSQCSANGVTTLNSRVSSTESDVENLSSRMDTAENDIENLLGNFNSIEDKVNDYVDLRMQYHEVRATTKPPYTCNDAIATTKFVWDVLIACGLVSTSGEESET